MRPSIFSLVLLSALAMPAPALANTRILGCFDLSEDVNLCVQVQPDRYDPWGSRQRGYDYPPRRVHPSRRYHQDQFNGSCAKFRPQGAYENHPEVQRLVARINEWECYIADRSRDIEELNRQRLARPHVHDRDKERRRQLYLSEQIRVAQVHIREAQQRIGSLKRDYQLFIQDLRQREALQRRRYYRH